MKSNGTPVCLPKRRYAKRTPLPSMNCVGAVTCVWIMVDGSVLSLVIPTVLSGSCHPNIANLNQDGRWTVHGGSGGWTRHHPAKRGKHEAVELGVIEAIVRCLTDGKVVDPLQKTFPVE